jgi:hypothetical protein
MRTPNPKLVGVSIVQDVLIGSHKYVLIEVRTATPVLSYCFTVETELIGPAMLNGAPILGTKMMVRRFSTGDVTFGCPNGAHLRGPTLQQSAEWGMRAEQGSFPCLKDEF